MFVSPLFLIAAVAGAAVPLILHMMQTKKRVKMPFPTLRFLQLAQKQSSRRIKIENWLLWLIRTLIMLFLGMAFAMPILRKQGFAWLGETPRDVAIVIDASYSMGYNTGRDTVWTKSVDAAKTIIEGLDENDRFCIFVARELSEPIIAEPVGDKDLALGRLDSLQPGTGSSQLVPAVTAAVKALRKDRRGRELELHVLSDNQALPWEGFGGGAKGGSTVSWDPGILDDRVAVFVTLLGVSAPENTGPAEVELLPAIVRPGSPAQVTATLSRNGSSSRTTATLFINGEQSARRSLGAGGVDDESSMFPLPPLPVGVHEGRIETPADNLPIDDAFHFLIRVEERKPTLVVGSADDTLFIRTALRTAAGRNGEAPKLIAPDQVTEVALDQYACVILCNALPMSGQAIGALEDFVRMGRMLVVFPGIEASVAAYGSWNCLPGKPVAMVEVPLAMRRRTLGWDQPRHPMVRALRKGGSVPPLTVRRSLVWEGLEEDTQTLISMGSGQPFLLDRAFGDGRVLFYAVSADRTWSDFPLSPFYLPMVVQSVDFSAGLGSKDPYYWAGDSLPLAGLVPSASLGVSVLDPRGREIAVRSTMQDGRTRLVAEGLDEPGVYSLAGSAVRGEEQLFAVNLRRREADLTPLADDAVRDRIGAEVLYLAEDLVTLENFMTDHRVGRSYGEHLLWAAFLLAILEFSLANLLSRKQEEANTIGTNTAGQITGHA